jgi:NitT/TauT family transport system substrate-binding protein
MRTHLRALLRVSAGALVALAAATAPAAAQQTKNVRFALDWAFLSYQAPFTIPVDDGTFTKLGLNVTVDRGVGSADAVAKVAGGAYDLGHADMYTVARFNAQNPDRKLIGVMLTHDKSAVAVTVLKKSGIATPAQLAGKKLAAPPGDSSRQVFPLLAAANNLDPAKVSWIDVTADLRETLLVRGEADGISGQITTVVPNLQALGVKKDDYTVLAYADHGVDLYGHVVITRPDFAEKNPEVVRSYLTGLAHGFRVMLNDPKAAVASIKKRDAFLKDDLELSRLQLANETTFFTPNVMQNGLSSPDKAKLGRSLELVGQVFGFKAPAVEEIYTDKYLPPREALQMKKN